MRIVGGSLRGRLLAGPSSNAIRPTSDRLRESIFDILAHAYDDPVAGANVADLFAGSGGLGLEALSRGAAKVVLVDKAAAAVEAAKENARALAHAGGEVQVFRQDARTAIGALADQGMRFDVVYLDPPYASDLYEPLLARLGEGPLLAEGGVVVAEHFHKRALPETIGALTRTRVKRVGDHCLSFYSHAGEAPGPWSEPAAAGNERESE